MKKLLNTTFLMENYYKMEQYRMPGFFKKMKRGINKSTKKVTKTVNKSVKAVEKTANKAVDQVEKRVNDRVDLIKDTTINIRNIINDKDKMPPAVERFIKKHGGETISSVVICRSKVPAAITATLKVLSTVPYDSLFHLFLLITTNAGTTFILEKNERILISKTIPKNIEKKLPMSELNGKVVEDVFYGTRVYMGDRFLPYNASSNNCQNFILSILHSQKINKPEYNTFIKQDTSAIFEGKDGLRKVANSAVKAGKVANMLMAGGSVAPKKVNSWLSHVKNYREEHPGVSYTVALKESAKTYNKK